MAELDKNTHSFTVKDLLRLIGISVLLIVWAFVWMLFGVPIHDLRNWMLEQRFTHANIQHPPNSIFLARRSFLGGPSEHGSAQCVYATGEVRRTTLSKNEIIDAYKNKKIGRFPLKVYFTDESELPYEVPFSEWQGGLENVGTSSVYIVYASVITFFLGDLRCDD